MDPLRIALIGYGTVGRDVVAWLASHRDECAERAGRPIDVVRIAVADPDRPRPVPAPFTPLVDGDAAGLCRDPDVDLVVELAGGVEGPEEWIALALESGKDVVTANKAVLATRGDALFDRARQHGRALLHEASVAAAIPVLQVLEHGLPAGPVDRVTAILNGTSNRILERLAEGVPFDAAVAEAQRDGFAEADPSLDLSGWDAAHKLALLARIVLGTSVPLDGLRVEGIERVEPLDLAFGAHHGWVLKSLAQLRRTSEGCSLGVGPRWIDSGDALATVHDEDNALLLEGEPFGRLVLQGKGAGGAPTAGSVVADILRAARGERGVPPTTGESPCILDPGEDPVRHYVRFRVKDRPGVLAHCAGVLADEEVSIASVEQPEGQDAARVPVFIITHPVPTTRLDRALAKLHPDEFLSEEPLRIPIDRSCDRPSGATGGSAPWPE